MREGGGGSSERGWGGGVGVISSERDTKTTRNIVFVSSVLNLPHLTLSIYSFT